MRRKTPHYWQQATNELAANDAVMAQLIAAYPGEILASRGDPFYSLCRSIVGQQISVKAADAISARLDALVPNITPTHLLRADDAALLSIGLSRQKVAYLKNIAAHFDREGWDHPTLLEMPEDELRASLLSIKGVGTWTVDMFLIFALLHPNVFPEKDLGLLKAIDRHYTPLSSGNKTHLKKLQKLWHPWNSVATWYCWRSLDPVPVEY